MTYNIIACGDSGKQWDGTGLNIGVNDSAKWGHKIHTLLLANHPGKFSPDRLSVITSTNPEKVYTNGWTWNDYFKNIQLIKLKSWDGHLKQGTIHHTSTSPFIAMSLAYNLGATKIVLWGVDFKNHPVINEHHGLNQEVRQYKDLTTELRKVGVKVFLGAKCSVLEEFLTIEE